jgi:hypothetical protein
VTEEAVKTITVTGAGPELADGVYRLVQRRDDGTIVLEPAEELTLEQVERDLTLTPMAPEELDRLIGHLPSDEEG